MYSMIHALFRGIWARKILVLHEESIHFFYLRKIRIKKKNPLKLQKKLFIASERTDQIFLPIASVPSLHHFFPHT